MAATRNRPPRRLQLNSLDRCRRELGRLYIEARQGELPPADFAHLAEGLAVVARLVEVNELERRLAS